MQKFLFAVILAAVAIPAQAQVIPPKAKDQKPLLLPELEYRQREQKKSDEPAKTRKATRQNVAPVLAPVIVIQQPAFHSADVQVPGYNGGTISIYVTGSKAMTEKAIDSANRELERQASMRLHGRPPMRPPVIVVPPPRRVIVVEQD